MRSSLRHVQQVVRQAPIGSMGLADAWQKSERL